MLLIQLIYIISFFSVVEILTLNSPYYHKIAKAFHVLLLFKISPMSYIMLEEDPELWHSYSTLSLHFKHDNIRSKIVSVQV